MSKYWQNYDEWVPKEQAEEIIKDLTAKVKAAFYAGYGEGVEGWDTADEAYERVQPGLSPDE